MAITVTKPFRMGSNFEWKDKSQAAEDFRRLATRYPDVKAKCFDVKFRDCEHFDSRNTLKRHLAPETLAKTSLTWIRC